jgi:fructose-bisphosphate aldolase class II
MALVSIAQELERAQAGRYALPLFDTFDMHSTEGMFNVLEEKRAPAMVAIYASTMDRPNARALAAYIRARAEDCSVPVSLMLDHGRSFEECIRAIHYGFTDVMYDGSKLSFEENVETTRAVVRAAHAVGVPVEAELGHVGRGADYEDLEVRRQGYTNPDDAVRFVEQTCVDFLAVAIGTAHGLYRSEPQLDMELLSEIRARVEVPLVLHGGSGVTEDQFREAIRRGISKINVATDLYVTAGRRLVEAAQAEGASYHSLTGAAIVSFQERCGYYLDLFGASGNA